MSTRKVWLELSENEAEDLMRLIEEGAGAMFESDGYSISLEGIDNRGRDRIHAMNAIEKLRAAVERGNEKPRGMGPWSLQ